MDWSEVEVSSVQSLIAGQARGVDVMTKASGIDKVFVPILVNTVPLDDGDQLFAKDASAAKAAKRSKVLTGDIQAAAQHRKKAASSK